MSSVKSENSATTATAVASPRLSRSPSPSKKSVIETRRAEQNRAAQRAFRQRKERYVKELEAKVNSMADWPSRMEQLELENEQLKRRIKQLEEENKAYKTPNLSYNSAVKYPLISTTTPTTNINIDENTTMIESTIQQQSQQQQQQQQKVVGEKGKVLDDLVSILRTRHRPPI